MRRHEDGNGRYGGCHSTNVFDDHTSTSHAVGRGAADAVVMHRDGWEAQINNGSMGGQLVNAITSQCHNY